MVSYSLSYQTSKVAGVGEWVAGVVVALLLRFVSADLFSSASVQFLLGRVTRNFVLTFARRIHFYVAIFLFLCEVCACGVNVLYDVMYWHAAHTSIDTRDALYAKCEAFFV